MSKSNDVLLCLTILLAYFYYISDLGIHPRNTERAFRIKLNSSNNVQQKLHLALG